MTYLDRVAADQLDEENWRRIRATGLGASDVANYAKPESVGIYIRQKIEATSSAMFRGNEYTRNGKHWEARMVNAYGFDMNTLMFHADGTGYPHTKFFATPDGVIETGGGLLLAEAKVKHVTEPPTEIKIPATHRRQMWWAQYVLGSRLTRYIVLYVDERGMPYGPPESVMFERDDDAIGKLVAISTPVLAALTYVLEHPLEGM